MKQLIIYSCLFLLILSACSTSARLAKANQAFEEGGYYKATRSYRRLMSKASKMSPLDADLMRFRLGECYRITGKYKEAQTAYESMFRRRTPQINEVYLRYGQVLVANGQYDKAKEQLLLYKKYVSGNPLSDSLLAAAEWAKTNVEQQVLYTVKAATVLNSRNSDYAPVYASNDYEILYLTSTRKAGNRTSKSYDVTGEATGDLFVSSFTRRGAWSRPAPVSEVLNSKDEEGACAFNSAYDQIYFTRCMKQRREKMGCAIYTSTRRDEEWSEPEKLPIADDSVTVAHPSISDDELTLYFASDLAGGYGGMDLWKVTRGSSEDDTWGEPVNLGKGINTGGNEMFPFIHANGTLYFVSDGHPGLGGLDIFKATPQQSEWAITNMGAPVNSPADDFSIIFERDNDRGFFASNRRPGNGRDAIYSFAGVEKKMVEYYFTVQVQDIKTGRNLPNAEVRLVGSNGATVRRKTGNDGTVEFRVNAATNYLAVSSLRGYLNQKTRFSSNGWVDNYNFHDTLRMTSTDRPIEIPNIFFEFAKATLTDDSRTALDSLLMIMNDNPGLVIELRAHTDSRGGDEANYLMSQQRAQAVVDYLVDHGIDPGRIDAVGMGRSQPRVTDAAVVKRYPFLLANTRLDDRYINGLNNNDRQEICHSLNRRIEFQVIGDNYRGAPGL